MATKTVLNCLVETHKHVKEVQRNINIFIRELINRGEKHDDSKFEEPELTVFAENTEKLGATEYGSEEYKVLLEQVKPAITNHYAKNRHHPEHWANGINDMTLVDLLEMIADWKAATKRNKDGNIRTSIEKNSDRYRIDPQLRQILENTVREHFTE